ncbi:hypothetical protein Vafri_21543, partial [Volvox africanus]
RTGFTSVRRSRITSSVVYWIPRFTKCGKSCASLYDTFSADFEVFKMSADIFMCVPGTLPPLMRALGNVHLHMLLPPSGELALGTYLLCINPQTSIYIKSGS